MKNKTVKSERKSFLVYSLKSLLVDKRAYMMLFISVVCMVVMSMNIIIYNSSVSRGENDTVIRQYGDYHAAFKQIDKETSLYIDMYGHIGQIANVTTVCKVANPNKASDISSATLAGYTDGLGSLYINVESGSYPQDGQIMISDEISRAFSLYVGDKTGIRVRYSGYVQDKDYTVCGIFSSAQAARGYIFISQGELDSILSIDTYSGSPLYDKYVSYDTDFAPKIKRHTDEIIEYMRKNAQDEEEKEDAQYEDEEESKEEIRSLYLNTAVVSLKKFYQKPSFLITMVMSVLPAAVAMLVFVTLDIFKSMKELSVLSMIGTTPKQFFKLLISKYFVIYLASFPVGVILSAVVIKILCVVCGRMNNNEKIYLAFHIDGAAVCIMFAMCLAILGGITYYVSQKTTAVSYTKMISASNDVNNIFVANSANRLLSGGKKLRTIGVTFFVRNRRVNTMFCVVMAVLMGIFSYFSMVLCQQVGSIPVAVDRGDFTIVGDEAIGVQFSTIDDSTVDKIENINGVKRVIKSYYVTDYYDEVIPLIRLNPAKIISKPKTKLTATLQKSYITDVLAMSYEQDRAEFLFGRYVVSGSLDNVFNNEGSVAIFVHDWQNSSDYYRVGDTVDLRASYVTENGAAVRNYEYKKYTVGAVLYDPLDKYENIDVVRILSDTETFKTLTYMTEPAMLEVVLENNTDEEMTRVGEILRGICKTDAVRYTDSKTEYLQNKAQMISSVMFYGILWIIILCIVVMLLITMTDYLLVSNSQTSKTLNMIGCGANGLFKIFGTEFFCCGSLSAIMGILLSIVMIIAYSSFASIPYNGYIYAILTASVAIPSVLCTCIPLAVSKRFFNGGGRK